MAGTKAYIIEETNFDPREITLEDFIKLYETESTEKGNRKNQSWGNKIRKNPVYKGFLNEPVINILDATTQIDGANIYKAAQDAENKAKGDLQSKIRVLESNILPKIQEIQAREGVDLSRFTSLTTTVPTIATAGQKLTTTTQFDSNKMGELVANLEEHVKKNPLDRPKANAILLMLEMGARPSLPTEIISSDYVISTVTPEAEMLGVGVRTDGLHIPAERTGVKRQAGGQTPNVQPFNAPLSQRAITILQDQSQYNARTFDESVRLENFFQVADNKGVPRPLDLDKDINTLLKLVTPPGTVRKLKGGKFVPTNDPLTSKNFRTIWTNIANNALNDPAKIAALQSRDVGTNTGSVAVYLGQAGDYQPAAVADLNEISRKSWGLYTLRNAEGRDQFKKGNLLSTSTFLFDTPPEQRTYEVFGRGQAANVPIQIGGFSAPKDDSPISNELQDAETTRAANNIADGGSEYVPYTENQITELKTAGLWTDDMQKRHDEYMAKRQGSGGLSSGKLLTGAMAGLGVYSFIEDAGATMRDVAIEGAATAARLGPKVGGALPMILSSSPAYAPEREPKPTMAEDPYPGQPEYQSFRQMRDIAMEPAIDESVNDMERMALEDSGGFVTRNREPEVSPAPKAGFIR